MKINELNDANFDLNAFWHHQHGIYISYYILQNMGLKAAIVFGELINEYQRWRGSRQLQEDATFYCTVDDMEKKIGIKEDNQRKILNELCEKGLISVIRRGNPYKRFFRLNIPNIVSLFDYDKNFEQKIDDAIEDEEYDYSRNQSYFIDYREHFNQKNLLPTPAKVGFNTRKSRGEHPQKSGLTPAKVGGNNNIILIENKLDIKNNTSGTEVPEKINKKFYFSDTSDVSNDKKENMDVSPAETVTEKSKKTKNKMILNAKPEVGVSNLVSMKLNEVDNEESRRKYQEHIEQEKEKRYKQKQGKKGAMIRRDIKHSKDMIKSEKVLEELTNYLNMFCETWDFVPNTNSWELKLQDLIAIAPTEQEQLDLIKLAIKNCWKGFYKPSSNINSGRPVGGTLHTDYKPVGFNDMSEEDIAKIEMSSLDF